MYKVMYKKLKIEETLATPEYSSRQTDFIETFHDLEGLSSENLYLATKNKAIELMEWFAGEYRAKYKTNDRQSSAPQVLTFLTYSIKFLNNENVAHNLLDDGNLAIFNTNTIAERKDEYSGFREQLEIILEILDVYINFSKNIEEDKSQDIYTQKIAILADAIGKNIKALE